MSGVGCKPDYQDVRSLQANDVQTTIDSIKVAPNHRTSAFAANCFRGRGYKAMFQMLAVLRNLNEA
jgi:hypothetical protein